MRSGRVGVLAHLERDVVEHRQVGEQRAELEQHAHAPAHLVYAVRDRGRSRARRRLSRRPRLGFTTPAINRSSVVLPEPLTPMIATTLPRGITMSIPVRIGTTIVGEA